MSTTTAQPAAQATAADESYGIDDVAFSGRAVLAAAESAALSA